MLKSLGVMIGTWDVKGREAGPDGETHGGATFGWTEGGFYLLQRVDMVDPTLAPIGGFDVRKVIASEFVSLDGVIEGPIWTFQVPSEEQPKFKFDELAARSDALPLGRVTYEGFVAAWPHMTEQAGEYADMMNGYPKFVVSTTLEEPLDWNNSRLIKENVAEEVSRLKQQPGKNILIFGSSDLVNTLMEHDLIDEYRLMLFPVVVGSGKRLFRDGSDTKALRLIETKTFGSGVVLSYRPAGNEQKDKWNWGRLSSKSAKGWILDL